MRYGDYNTGQRADRALREDMRGTMREIKRAKGKERKKEKRAGQGGC